eukprot:5308738-Amphidinium_carterae.1
MLIWSYLDVRRCTPSIGDVHLKTWSPKKGCKHLPQASWSSCNSSKKPMSGSKQEQFHQKSLRQRHHFCLKQNKNLARQEQFHQKRTKPFRSRSNSIVGAGAGHPTKVQQTVVEVGLQYGRA